MHAITGSSIGFMRKKREQIELHIRLSAFNPDRELILGGGILLDTVRRV